MKHEKPEGLKKQVLFIDAADQVRTGRAQNYLEDEHIDRIYDWYDAATDVENYVKLASLEEIAENDHNLNIPLYVEKVIEDDLSTVAEALTELKEAWAGAQAAEGRFRNLLRGFTK